MKQHETPRKPFFVQFLEGQNRSQEDTQGIIPWPWPTTAPAKDNLETHKAPSDSDEEIFI
jgi:Serine endopeptidase inhibitors.